MKSFNTASGRYYCNVCQKQHFYVLALLYSVSIPQAVGTIAIPYVFSAKANSIAVSIPQAVGTIAIEKKGKEIKSVAFQYRKR